jgi:hypothetical protein
VPQDLLKAIDEIAGKEAVSRSRWIKRTLRNAINGRTLGTPIEADFRDVQELIEVEMAAVRQSLHATGEVHQLLESSVKLAMEAVLIGRQLALVQGPAILEKAPINAGACTCRLATAETNRTPNENGR